MPQDINQWKPCLSLVTEDFNVRLSSRLSDGVNTIEGTKLFSLTSCEGYQQIIDETIYIQRQSSSCIDLICKYQLNLWDTSGIHPSLQPNRYHQIIHSKFDLNIFYPPPYQHLVLDYKNVNVYSILEDLHLMNWENLCSNKI